MLAQLAFALINGLSAGMALFLVAAGLTLIFGIVRILNFAHGSFFMIGAYIAFSLLRRFDLGLPGFIGAGLVAGFVVGLIGILIDKLILQRLRHLDEAYMLIATFGLLMVCQGAVQLIWGGDFHSITAPDALSGAVMIGPVAVPVYSLFLICVGACVFLALDVCIHRLWIGKVIQALAADRWMTGLLGVDAPLLFSGVVVTAFMLAGLAGGLMLPNQALSPDLGNAYTLQAFIAVVIGGPGNVRGAFLAALLLGLIESFSSILLPNAPGLAIFAAMIAALLWRPDGLLQRGTLHWRV